MFLYFTVSFVLVFSTKAESGAHGLLSGSGGVEMVHLHLQSGGAWETAPHVQINFVLWKKYMLLSL